MLLGIAFTNAALKSLENLPQKFRGQCKKKIEALAADPFPAGCKKLVNVMIGEDAVYRLRSGDYRILYIVKGNPQQVVVIDIENRKDAYR
jgi:mRNA interferase RelE/StbE